VDYDTKKENFDSGTEQFRKDLMDHIQTYQPLLFSIAYRMTGYASQAEDIVQDAYLRYQQADQAAIQSPKSYQSVGVIEAAAKNEPMASISGAPIQHWQSRPIEKPGHQRATALAEALPILWAQYAPCDISHITEQAPRWV
jgi:hypothetical protein